MFVYIVLFTALLIASCAGYFSITGIGQLFTGATISAMIMATALEVGKLVVVSFLYRRWQHISKLLRIYYIAASFVLMSITSVGVYGYLSSAYAASASGINSTEAQIAAISSQQQSLLTSKDRLNTQLIQSTASLRQQENRLDGMVGKSGFITQQKTVQQQNTQVDRLQSQLMAVSTTYDSLQFEATRLKSSISTSSKIGTFYYVADMLGVPLDTIVRWFILSIVLVFDPLSITLLIAYNSLRDTSISTPINQDILPVEPPPVDLTPTVVEATDAPTEVAPQLSEEEQIFRRRHGINIGE